MWKFSNHLLPKTETYQSFQQFIFILAVKWSLKGNIVQGYLSSNYKPRMFSNNLGVLQTLVNNAFILLKSMILSTDLTKLTNTWFLYLWLSGVWKLKPYKDIFQIIISLECSLTSLVCSKPELTNILFYRKTWFYPLVYKIQIVG